MFYIAKMSKINNFEQYEQPFSNKY